MGTGSFSSKETKKFDFPSPPEFLPEWARREGEPWSGMDDFSILVRAEEQTGKVLDIAYPRLPGGVWGFHLVRGKRAGIFVNSLLPLPWRRFALFHELFHLLNHRKGAEFWLGTAAPPSSFEHQADLFAWAAAFREWRTCWEDQSP